MAEYTVIRGEFVIVGNHDPKLLFPPRHKLARRRLLSFPFRSIPLARSDFCSLSAF